MKLRLLFLLLLVFEFNITFARNLGVFGETFEIQEKDLLECIFSRLKELQETGKLEMEQKKVTERVKKMILHPQPIAGITPTQMRREYYFDPTITVTRNLSDHRGQIFAHKGEKFNPLDKINMSKPLLFIDGDDDKQVKWAISLTRSAIAKIKDISIQGHEFSKIILVQGSPLDLQKRINRDIYFDQHGILTTKLGIKHVPAIVFQKKGENVLTVIEEVLAEEDNR